MAKHGLTFSKYPALLELEPHGGEDLGLHLIYIIKVNLHKLYA